MTKVVVAYAEPDARAADRLARALSRSGVAVEKRGPKEFRACDGDGAVLLLWSRHAAQNPSLRRAAAAAKAKGRLSLALIGGAPRPASLRSAPSAVVRSDNPRLKKLVKVLSQEASMSTHTSAARSAAPPRPSDAPQSSAQIIELIRARPGNESEERVGKAVAIGALLAFVAFGFIGVLA